MAEGAQVENSSLNKKPATDCVWDVQYFQNQALAASLACVELSNHNSNLQTSSLL